MDFKLGTSYEEWVSINCDKAKAMVEKDERQKEEQDEIN